MVKVMDPTSAPAGTGSVNEHELVPPVVQLDRRRVDTLLVGAGAVVTVVLVVAGALLTWGSNFTDDYVGEELAAQNITFPTAEALEAEGRGDLVEYADQLLTNGEQAEAYASYIGGHVTNIADGATYADLSGPERAAKAAVNEAIANDAPAEEIEALQGEANKIAGQRESIFKGEMLRGTLLNTYAWSTIGRIAGIAAMAAYGAAVVMFGLVVAGVLHLRRISR